MDKISIREEIIEIKTIQILLDDKIHRIQDLITRLSKRIEKIEDGIREREEVSA